MTDFLLSSESTRSCCSCSTTSALGLLAGSQLEVSSVSDRELEDDFGSAGFASAETDFLLSLEAARDGSLALTTDFLETMDFLLLLDSGLVSFSSYKTN